MNIDTKDFGHVCPKYSAHLGPLAICELHSSLQCVLHDDGTTILQYYYVILLHFVFVRLYCRVCIPSGIYLLAGQLALVSCYHASLYIMCDDTNQHPKNNPKQWDQMHKSTG